MGIPPLRSKELYLGTDTETSERIRLSHRWLETHLHLIGPPGSGKSRLLLSLFQRLAGIPNATIVLLNPKGALARQARDWTIAHGLTKRLVWFDVGEPEHVIGYDPLRPNGLPIHTHAKAARESFRSAWGQGSFDETPQLARLLFLSLAVTRALQMPLPNAVRLLRSDATGSHFRQTLLPALNDPFLSEALAWYDSLNERRQDELAASTLARLEAFVCDPVIRRIFTQPRSLDLGDVITNHKIFLLNLEIGRPLRSDDVALLGRFIVNDLLGHVFGRPKPDSPVYLFLDEVELFATRDLCSALDMGRELGLHCILAHQDLGQLRGPKGETQFVYDSVMGCARTKILFGGLSTADLRVLTEEVAIDQYDPYKVKDELTTLILDPVESTRNVLSLGGAVGRSNTRSEGKSRTVTQSNSVGISVNEGISSTRAASSAHGVTSRDEVDTLMESESATESETDHSGQSIHQTASQSESDATQFARSRGHNLAFNTGLSRVPFYEYKKHWRVSSRTFLTEQEFLTLQLQKIKAQPQAHCFVKVPGKRGRFVALPRITDPWISARTREAGLQRVFGQPFYSTHEECEMLESNQRSLPPATEAEDSFSGHEIVPARKSRHKPRK